jgi:hypothetical protein
MIGVEFETERAAFRVFRRLRSYEEGWSLFGTRIYCSFSSRRGATDVDEVTPLDVALVGGDVTYHMNALAAMPPADKEAFVAQIKDCFVVLPTGDMWADGETFRFLPVSKCVPVLKRQKVASE